MLISFFLLSFYMGRAQSITNGSDSYKVAVGLKIWDGAGISYKQFLTYNTAAEVQGYFYYKGFRLTALYQKYGNIGDLSGLKWYLGAGAHMGFYKSLNGHSRSTVIGIDGVAGLDYKFDNAPVNISLDWQPGFEFASGFGYSGWGGLGIRYTLK